MRLVQRLIEGMWVQHVESSLGASGSGGTAENNLFTVIFADGCNLNNVSLTGTSGSNLTATNNFIRGTGDDGMAINSVAYNGSTTYTAMSDITMSHNTVTAPWGGKGIGVYGGSGHLVEENFISDTARYIGHQRHRDRQHDHQFGVRLDRLLHLHQHQPGQQHDHQPVAQRDRDLAAVLPGSHRQRHHHRQHGERAGFRFLRLQQRLQRLHGDAQRQQPADRQQRRPLRRDGGRGAGRRAGRELRHRRPGGGLQRHLDQRHRQQLPVRRHRPGDHVRHGRRLRPGLDVRRAVVPLHRQRGLGRNLYRQLPRRRPLRRDRRPAPVQRVRREPERNVNIPATGGWQNWTTVTATVQLTAGQQTLAVDQDNGGWNLNYLSFAGSGGGGTSSPLTASPSSLSFGNATASAGYTFNPSTGNTVTVTFAAATVRYVKLTFTANTGWSAGQLSELQVYSS